MKSTLYNGPLKEPKKVLFTMWILLSVKLSTLYTDILNEKKINSRNR